MKYLKAEKVLPAELINLIQNYIDGECLYIPRRKDKKRAWGENNGTKKYLQIRNEEIFLHYSSGKSISNLAIEYCLSEKSIEGIVYKQKKDHN